MSRKSSKLTAPSPSTSREVTMFSHFSKDNPIPKFSITSCSSSPVKISFPSSSKASNAALRTFARIPVSRPFVFISKNSFMHNNPSLFLSPCCIIALTS
ncbi:unnamed protein product [Trifolium pratense]|uniref:Uncharacterized protein n=1 Tax=Trifolium pratense TaxID=57577 RepID=A0ACB0JVX4_TRIPR|nr:unnamed protein product [Trifolium pratense]